MFPKPNSKVPSISTEQMIEVDRLMIEHYGIELIQMMENAGRGLALLAKAWLGGTVKDASIMVLGGTGGNGGGAMVAARRLHNWGANVMVILTKPGELYGVPQQQAEILAAMNLPIFGPHALQEDRYPFSPALILDGIIGYSLAGHPRGAAAELIQWANAQTAPTISLDTPSGISLTKGEVFDPVIIAEATLTLALPKHGLFAEEVLPYRGDLYLADISVPPELYAAKSIDLKVKPIFEPGDLLLLDEKRKP